MMTKKKAPNPTDIYVGNRVRARRMMLAMSQEKLGIALGLTFQQVQKYEKGINRIGASRLQQIATVLQVAPSFFFEGAPNAGTGRTDDDGAAMLNQFLGTPGAAAFARFYLKMDRRSRAAILEVGALLARESTRQGREAA